MKKNSKIEFLIITITLLSFVCPKPYEKILVMSDWKVKIFNCPKNKDSAAIQNLQLETNLPTTIHLDLIEHGKIQDPFFAANWQDQKWVSQCSAKYSRTIVLDQQHLNYSQINLVFDGIDTYSSIYLNKYLLQKTSNAFTSYKSSIKSLLKAGANLLTIQILPTHIFDTLGQSKNRMPFDYAHTRKPCYQYSWDWAPFMNTLGVWKDVYVEVYDQFKIDYTWIRIQSLKHDLAILNFAVKLDIGSSEHNFQQYKIQVQSQGLEKQLFQVKGVDTYFMIKIQNPRLWWPNGIGKPNIYNFTIKLIYGQKQIDQRSITYGIRSVELDQSNNKFTLMINGYKINCKGANYVPMDMLYPRLSNPFYKSGNTLIQLLQDAVKSNFNMIRLWGGGQYQSQQFYQLCSKMGLMVFHDFMFSDSIYPSDDQFIQNVQREVVTQIRRIRNYPCLTLWSGNNQILQGIMSWGWSSQKYRDDYKKLFQQVIGKIVKQESPNIPYIPSSPVKGVGNGGFQRGGDIHYWGVWAAGSSFQSYQTAIGPFNSEFGTQSLPVWQTVQQFTSKQGRQYSSKQLQSHQRHSSKFSTLRKYINQYSKPSSNFEVQVYISGLIQEYAIQTAIKAQRCSNISMGTLYWQFNDAWPAISWSSIDYYGRWKPLQYKVKSLYQNVIAFYQHNQGKVFAINDNIYSINAKIQTKAISFDGEVLAKEIKSVQLRENQRKQVITFDKKLLQSHAANVVISTKITYGDSPLEQITTNTFIRHYKDLKLPKCQLDVTYKIQDNDIILSSKCLLKSVHIYHPLRYLQLQDNYIDLLPGQSASIRLFNVKLKDIKHEIIFRSYLQVYDKDQLKVNAKVEQQE